MVAVVIGVDPAKRSNTIEVIDKSDTVLVTARFENNNADYRKMRALVRRWPDRVWAVEGATGVGLHLPQRLVADGERVVDVPSKLSTRVRAIDRVDFGGFERGRFLTENMLAGFEALERERRVKFVRNDDANGIELLAFREHGLDGFVGIGDAPFFACCGGGSGRGIGDGDDFSSGLAEARRVVLQHSACADDSYFDGHVRSVFRR